MINNKIKVITQEARKNKLKLKNFLIIKIEEKLIFNNFLKIEKIFLKNLHPNSKKL